MSERIKAPWTDAQVAALNKWQQLGFVHEFTCPHEHGEWRILTATKNGWWCQMCGYRQDWAHDFMCDEALHPKNPIASRRKVETWLMPDHADPNMRRFAPVAPPEKLAAAGFLICRRLTDDPPPDVATATEFRATCIECGEPIMHRVLPKPNVQLICVYCWHDMKQRGNR